MTSPPLALMSLTPSVPSEPVPVRMTPMAWPSWVAGQSAKEMIDRGASRRLRCSSFERRRWVSIALRFALGGMT